MSDTPEAKKQSVEFTARLFEMAARRVREGRYNEALGVAADAAEVTAKLLMEALRQPTEG